MKNLKFINKFIKADDSGRSMVEMLGVLAIVGVISVGGIAGYIYGMNRYRTNEILDGASKRAVVVAGQIALEIEPNLTEFVDYDETAGGTFSSSVERWDTEFGLKISGVKKEVCENLIRMIGDNTPLRAIVDASNPADETDLNPGECADGTNNNLYLVYNIEMLSNQAAGDSGDRTVCDPACRPGFTCWNGSCECHGYEASPGEVCTPCEVQFGANWHWNRSTRSCVEGVAGGGGSGGSGVSHECGSGHYWNDSSQTCEEDTCYGRTCTNCEGVCDCGECFSCEGYYGPNWVWSSSSNTCEALSPSPSSSGSSWTGGCGSGIDIGGGLCWGSPLEIPSGYPTCSGYYGSGAYWDSGDNTCKCDNWVSPGMPDSCW